MNPSNRFLANAIVLLISLKSPAQTLTCQTNCPKPGEIFSTKTCSPVLHTSGQNQVWDFTQVAAVSSNVFIVSYHDPVTISSASVYPQSNLARQGFGQYTFLETSANGIQLATAINTTVNAQSLVLPLPFSYGSTHAETITTTYLSGADTIKVTVRKKLEGAGTGTLMLPGSTYTNVLRISGQTVQSSTKNGVADPNVITNNFNYYYSPTISHPLLFSEYPWETGPRDYAPFTQFLSGILTGIQREDGKSLSGFQISPNPASGTLRLSGLGNDSGEIIICEALGKVVLKQKYQTETIELDVRELPAGLYIIQNVSRKEFESKRILVER